MVFVYSGNNVNNWLSQFLYTGPFKNAVKHFKGHWNKKKLISKKNTTVRCLGTATKCVKILWKYDSSMTSLKVFYSIYEGTYKSVFEFKVNKDR